MMWRGMSRREEEGKVNYTWRMKFRNAGCSSAGVEGRGETRSEEGHTKPIWKVKVRDVSCSNADVSRRRKRRGERRESCETLTD